MMPQKQHSRTQLITWQNNTPNQIKSGLIDANLPPSAPGGKDEKWYKRKNILSRTIMTGTIGLGGAAVLGVLTLLYMNSRESKTSTEEAKS